MNQKVKDETWGEPNFGNILGRALVWDVHAEPDREIFDRLVKGQKAALARGLVNQRRFLTVGRAGLERETNLIVMSSKESSCSD